MGKIGEGDSVILTNDAGETTAVTINKNTGAVISTTNLGKIGKNYDNFFRKCLGGKNETFNNSPHGCICTGS